jgi:hypothetical protein
MSSRSRRFERLERARPATPETRTQGAGVGERFGAVTGGDAPAAADAVAHGTSAEARFRSDPSAEKPLRLLELDEGQPFVRCARCRRDAYRTAASCTFCGADLDTQEQRAYNEAYWKERQADADAQRAELERLRVARETAERELAEATRELRRRAADRRGDDEELGDPFRAGFKAIGLWLGTWLRRAFPDRALRIAVMTALAAGLAFLVVRFPTQAWAALSALGILVAIGAWFARLIRVFRE